MSDALAAVAIAAAPVHAERHRKMLEVIKQTKILSYVLDLEVSVRACEVLGDAGVAFALGTPHLRSDYLYPLHIQVILCDMYSIQQQATRRRWVPNSKLKLSQAYI
eukprot:1363219-Amorphochlora_amoeboformis.AAC.2